MLQMQRTEGRELVDVDGRSFSLVSETWSVRLATPWFGVGYSYQRPVGVEGTARSVPIRDHLMVARVVALIVVAAGAFISWRGR